MSLIAPYRVSVPRSLQNAEKTFETFIKKRNNMKTQKAKENTINMWVVLKRRSVHKPTAQAAARLRIRQHQWANTALDPHGKVTGSDGSSLLSPSKSLGRMIKHKKNIWLRKNIKLRMKNEIMASEWRSLQICWTGNHFKVNCSKSGLDLLLEKYLFSVYVT